MDVQLSDGVCFEIFRMVKITSPVIFCTAFGEYAMDAIKSNGIDYLLKPFSANDLDAAFLKVEGFRNFFQQRTQSDWQELIKRLDKPERKTSFPFSITTNTLRYAPSISLTPILNTILLTW
jgi:two-component SAPR family response regulator